MKESRARYVVDSVHRYVVDSVHTVAEPIANLDCDVVVCAVTQGKQLAGTAAAIDRLTSGAITTALNRGEFRGEAGDVLLLHLADNLGPRRAVVVGLGGTQVTGPREVRNAAATAGRFLLGRAPGKVALALGNDDGDAWVDQEAVDGFVSGLYDRALYKSDTGPAAEIELVVLSEHGNATDAQTGLILGAADWYIRDLISRPPNILTPTALADSAQQLAQAYGLEVAVLSEAEMRQEGFGGVLAVGGGSAHPPTFTILRYLKGSGPERTALIGKGITFDSGGLNLKGSGQLRTMKGDMAGAATVLGVLRACAEAQLPINLIGLIPAAENLPSGSSYRPDDVITALNGTTIEVDNTDAEGRLLLADAFAYAPRENVTQIVEISTLTAWVTVALGYHAFAVLGEPTTWTDELVQCASTTGERAWPLPVWPEHDEQVQSAIADVMNVGAGSVYGARVAGAITPVAFLKRFVPEQTPWAHLDIGGAFWNDHEVPHLAPGPTSIGMRTVFAFLQKLSRRQS